MIPDSPEGIKTLTRVCQRLAPRAREASLYVWGTALKASSERLIMVGRDMTARRIAPFRAFSPLEIPNTFEISGLTRTIPKNPTTTDGMPARISTAGFRISRRRGGANSDRKAAQATPNGTAITRAPTVTMSVLTIRERIPYLGVP